ncbi:MAG: hypothetical protein EAX95_05120 [Candidatus Thorarchaeota archaeon]|nr:hypothetical protein [Candidatus Thorarchaeota archaeon]
MQSSLARHVNKIGFSALLILLLVIPIVSMSDWMGPPPPTLTILEDEEVAGSESFQISSQPHLPTSTITILNDTSFDGVLPWGLWYSSEEFGLSRTFNLPLCNVTSANIAVEYQSAGNGHSIQMSVAFYESKVYYQDFISYDVVADSVSGAGCRNLSYAIPISTLNSETDSAIVGAGVSIEGTGSFGDDITILRFLVTATKVQPESLSPISFDLQRTNGESIFANPTFVLEREIYTNPLINLESSLLPNGTSFTPSQVNDTIFLPADHYSGTFIWGQFYNYSFSLVVEPQHSCHLILRVNMSSIRLVCNYAIPCFSTTMSSAGFNYWRYSTLEERLFYFPSNYTVFIRLRVYSLSNEAWFPDYGNLTLQVLGRSNSDITVLAEFNWFAFGSLAVSGPRLFVLLDFFIIVFALVYWFRKRLVSDSRILPFIGYLASLMLPWFNRLSAFFAPIYEDAYLNWSYAPGLAGSFVWQEGSMVLLSGMHTVAMGLPVIMWIIALVAFTMLYEEKAESSPRLKRIFVVLLVIGALLEMATLISFSSWGFSISVAPFFAMGSVVLCLLIEYHKKDGGKAVLG